MHRGGMTSISPELRRGIINFTRLKKCSWLNHSKLDVEGYTYKLPEINSIQPLLNPLRKSQERV